MTFKKFKYIRFLFLGILLLFFFSCSNYDDKISIVKLKCEYLKNPIGIDIITPRLSWEIKSNLNNVNQKGYHILVASSLDKLNNEIGDLWDSEKVISDNSSSVS